MSVMKRHDQNGRLNAVGGMDGSGKSTQIYLLKRWLELPSDEKSRKIKTAHTDDFFAHSSYGYSIFHHIFDSFIQYQRKMKNNFRELQDDDDFEIANGNRSLRAISPDLQRRIENLMDI